MQRRILLRAVPAAVAFAAAGAALIVAAPVDAATRTPFTQKALGAAQEANKPILIAVHAGWCPVCARQTPVIDSLMQKPEFQNLVILTIDFDTQKDALKALGVTRQSTLIAMHGSAERGRSVGVTAQDEIEALMMKTRT